MDKETVYDKSRLSSTVNHTLKMRANIRRVFWFFVLIFAALVWNIALFVAAEAEEAVSNPFNPRMAGAADVVRGSIYDASGTVLAHSIVSGSSLLRSYPHGRDFVHVVGFDGFGRSGVENNIALTRASSQVWQRVQSLLSEGSEPIRANNLVLTLDAELSQLAARHMNGRRGAVVVMEPSTGKILAMTSYPNHDPNAIAANWQELIADYSNAPLLNRASQGLYPPGSVFKITMAAAIHRHAHNHLEHYCNGEIFFDTPYGQVRIQCYNGLAHGLLDVSRAFALSCNTFFARAVMEYIGAENLRTVAQSMGFNTSLPFELGLGQSSFVLGEESPVAEIIQTAIGQGRTLVTPLHMAMLTSAVANGGIMMRPYVVDHALTASGREVSKVLPRAIGRVMDIDEAAFLSKIMTHATSEGTGAPAAIPGVSVASKTGTAEVDSGAEHGWFVAFAPAEQPEVVVAIILEHSGGPGAAMSITRSLMEHALGR